jgi:hypothetical protein
LVTFPPFSNIKSRIVSIDKGRDTAILNTTADEREQLTAEIRIIPASIAESVLWLCRRCSSWFQDSSLIHTVVVLLWKVKQSLYRSTTGPYVFRRQEAPRFLDNLHMKIIRLSALRTRRLYSARNIPINHFCWRPSHIVAEKIMSTKNSNDTTRNRALDLPACSAVPQPTAPLFGPVGYNTSNCVNREEGRIKSFRKANTAEVKNKRSLNTCIYFSGVFNTKFLFSYSYFVFVFL